MQNVLIIYFSQTGQLTRVAKSIAAPLQDTPGINLDWCAIKSTKPYPFPWPLLRFFDQFPEAVHLVPTDIEPLAIPSGKRYDLVILAHTVWYLSPPPAVTAFLKSPQGASLLQGVPVITVIACRNMWLMAHAQMKRMLTDIGAKLIDNVVLTDDCHPLASLITTPRWMLTGKTNRFLGMAAPGIKEEVIRASGRFGHAIRLSLLNGDHKKGQSILQGLGAANVDTRLIMSEFIGRRSFYLWGALIRLCGQPGSRRRVPLLVIYIAFLLTMICTLVPVTLLAHGLIKKLLNKKIATVKATLEEPSGSGNQRMGEFQ